MLRRPRCYLPLPHSAPSIGAASFPTLVRDSAQHRLHSQGLLLRLTLCCHASTSAKAYPSDRRGAAPATARGAQGRRRISCGWGQRGLHSRRSARLALRGRGQRRARDPRGLSRGPGTGPSRVGAGRSGLAQPAGEPAKRGSFRGKCEKSEISREKSESRAAGAEAHAKAIAST